MFGRRKPRRELSPPPIASSDTDAMEVLRVWAAPGRGQQVALRTCWQDPGAWGLALVDIARHAAQAYGREGVDPQHVLRRIRELFEAEWASPTSPVQDLTGDS